MSQLNTPTKADLLLAYEKCALDAARALTNLDDDEDDEDDDDDGAVTAAADDGDDAAA